MTPDHRVRLTAVSHNLAGEGAPRVLFELVRGLVARGRIDARIVTMVDGPLRRAFEGIGCDVQAVGSPLRRLRFALGLVSRGADVVLANTVLSHWAITAAARVGVRGIWFIHESQEPFSLFDTSRERARARRAITVAERVVFPAAATLALYRDVARHAQLSVCHNGFDRETFARAEAQRDRRSIRARWGVGEHDVVGVVVGTINERKSQLDVVEAIRQLEPATADRVVMFVVGDAGGAYASTVRAAASRLAHGRVRVVPFVEDVVDFYVGADFAVSASRVESFPRAIQEAMFFGLALIVAPVFGIAEQIVPGESALTFAAGDVRAMGSHIAAVVSDAALRRRLGAAARERLDQLPSLEGMIEQHEMWLCEAAARSRTLRRRG